jgi:hypothetical protein
MTLIKQNDVQLMYDLWNANPPFTVGWQGHLTFQPPYVILLDGVSKYVRKTAQLLNRLITPSVVLDDGAGSELFPSDPKLRRLWWHIHRTNLWHTVYQLYQSKTTVIVSGSVLSEWTPDTRHFKTAVGLWDATLSLLRKYHPQTDPQPILFLLIGDETVNPEETIYGQFCNRVFYLPNAEMGVPILGLQHAQDHPSPSLAYAFKIIDYLRGAS